MISTREAYGETLKELGATNPNIVVLDADVATSTMTCKFAEAYPERFFNMGIAEQDMIGTAAGLASCGKTVFASAFAVFMPGRCFDQIRNTVAEANANVKLVSTHSGITVGEDGASHQAIEDIALMRAVPNMRVFAPADDYEAQETIKYVTNTEGPFYVRLSRIKSERVYNSMEYEFDPIKGKVIFEGKDAAIISTGVITSEVIKAREELLQEGIDVAVIALNSIKPIDEDIIVETAKKYGKIITVEEHNIIGGLGSAVCEVLSEKYPTKVLRLGVNDKFGKSGKYEEVLNKYELDSKGIAKNIKKFLK